jgi:hypothetical protein
VSEFKVGDKVWVLCEVEEVHPEGEVLVSGLNGGEFYVSQSDCRTVEPQAKEPTRGQKLAQQALKGIWAANDAMNRTPVIKDYLTTEPNPLEIPNSSSDPINPSHYKHLPAEAIDIIEAAIAGAPSNKAAYLHGQSLKYPLRCWEKGGVDDLKKARWYLNRLISEVGE